jgi:hypothetical protein
MTPQIKNPIFKTLILITLFYATTGRSQNWEWAKNALDTSAGNSQSINVVSADKMGNVYAAGYFYGDTLIVGGLLLTSTFLGLTDDMLLVKYDTSGNVKWAKFSLTQWLLTTPAMHMCAATSIAILPDLAALPFMTQEKMAICSW